MHNFKELFVSYGRRESLGFVGRLHQQLKLAGYEAWFDKVNIPDGEDYAQRINHGIESAHNFVYVMAPRGMTSPYCLVELEYARILGKRVIPINQMVIFQTEVRELSEGDKQLLRGFYKCYNQPDPNIQTTQEVLNRSHALIGTTDWLDAQEQLTDEDCNQLAAWARSYENYWSRHEDLNYLATFEFAVFGRSIAPLKSVLNRITVVLERHKWYVHKHTEILALALDWQRHQKTTPFLVVGKERAAAETWLLTQFKEGEQLPCQPNALQCEFICEARKNAENMMTDGFVCYDARDRGIRDQVVRSLSRYAVTTWEHERDIQTGADYAQAIEQGIEYSDNFFYFISSHLVTSEYCHKELAHAVQYHKRIIPLLLEPVPAPDVPEIIQKLQYVDFTESADPNHYDLKIDDILNILEQDKIYYEQHKILLARALKWAAEERKPSFLLRGYHLENAQTWLRLNEKRTQHPPTELHRELIVASEATKGLLGTEVFISYSRKDGDFARQLNEALQQAGKTTWFDQESISYGADFEREIFKGIKSSDNFVFIISPDSVTSEYCEREVNYAAAENKRFISIRHRHTEPATMPEALRRIQWLDFEPAAFDKAFAELIQALDIDREHAHQHTILQQRATEWLEYHRSVDFLLNKTACNRAESWLQAAQAGDKIPKPTTHQIEYIQRSRATIVAAERVANRRRRMVLASMALGMIIALILASFALMQRHYALHDRAVSLSVLAKMKVKEGNATDGILLALEALPSRQKKLFDRSYVPEAETSLYEAVLKHRERRLMAGHRQNVYQVAFSPDGQQIVTAGGEGEVRLWEGRSGKLHQVLIGHMEKVAHAAFSPDGQQLVTASNDDTIRLWSATTGQLLHLLHGHQGNVNYVAFSPTGRRIVSASRDTTARLWETRSGKRLHLLTGHQDEVIQAGFSPNGQQVVTASGDQTVRLWEAHNGQLIHTLKGHGGTVLSAVFNPQGTQILSASQDGTARLWDVQSGELIHILAGHYGQVLQAVFSPNGQQIATASTDNTARLWNAQSGQLRHVLVGHQYFVLSVTFSRDGQQLVTTSRDNTARVWDTHSGRLHQILGGHDSGDVLNAAFSPDGTQVVTASQDDTARLWILSDHQVSHPLVGHEGPVPQVKTSPDGRRVITASEDNTARVWDGQTGQFLYALEHDKAVRHATFSSNGRLVVTASEDQTARLWNSDSGKLHHLLEGHQGQVNYATFSPDGKYVVTASEDETARIWEVQTGQLRHSFEHGNNNAVQMAAFSPNGQWVVTAVGNFGDNTARLWEVENGSLFQVLKGHTAAVNYATFSPNGKYVVTASEDGTARLWRADNGELLNILAQHEDEVRHAVFSPSGKQIVTVSADKKARWWDIPNGRLLHTFVGHEEPVNQAAISPDGKYLVTVSDDKTARLWNLAERQLRHIFTGHNQSVQGVAFSPDSKQVVTASRDGTARRWRVFSTQELIDYAHQKVPRCLSKRQREELHLPPDKSWDLLAKGQALTKTGHLAAATHQFEQAQQLAPGLKFDSDDKAREYAAQALIETGKKLAIEPNQLKEANAAFQKAQEIDSRFKIEVNDYVQQLAFKGLVDKGITLAEQGEITQAIAYSQKAQQMETRWEIPVELWENICLYGGYQYVEYEKEIEKIMVACDQAVMIALKKIKTRYYRGYVRELVGNIPGAIEDLEFVVKWAQDNELKQESQAQLKNWRAREKNFHELNR